MRIALLLFVAWSVLAPVGLRAQPVNSVQVVVPPNVGPVLKNVVQIFRRHVTERCQAKGSGSG